MALDPYESFYVVAHEPGAEHPALPTWANRTPDPLGLADHTPAAAVTRREVDGVPGAFQLFDVLDEAECDALIALTESLGYHPDASVSLGRDVRHNDNVVWVTDARTDAALWSRIARALAEEAIDYGGKDALGLNARFRFYRYRPGDYFAFHRDGAWPGSRVVNERLVNNAYPDRFSQMTFLLLLSDDFDGGATRFRVAGSRESGFHAVATIDVQTPRGGALCFPHGLHPQHCVHAGEPVRNGTKYILRTDVLFEV